MLTCWTWDNQITNISSKVSDGLRMLYLARKLAGNKGTLKTIYYSLVEPYFDYCDVVWGVCPGGVCSKTRADKLKSCKTEQHGLSLGLITLSDHPDVLTPLEWSNIEERGKRHLLVTMFQLFDNNCPTYLRETLVSGFIEPLKFTTVISVILGVLTMIPNCHYLKRFFLSVHSLIGVQLLRTNCQIRHVRYKILLALNSR